jgi:hypothetical protein
MNKTVYPALLLLVATGLAGCPVYDHEDDGCYTDSECAAGYLCDARQGLCYAPDSGSCTKPADCGPNETCGRLGICSPGNCRFDSVGCVEGYTCSVLDDRWQCIRGYDDGAGGAGGASGGAAGEAGNSR